MFTFAPQHKSLGAQLEGKRAWIEQVAQSITGRTIKVVAKDGEADGRRRHRADDPAHGAKAADLRGPREGGATVQAVLDVFGGEIEDGRGSESEELERAVSCFTSRDDQVTP